MADLVGQKLAHFRILAKLGEGGMGVVYRATDERLRREVALKVLPDDIAGSESRKRRFLREARSAAAATHACIAAVHEIGEADGYAFIAMELVDGTTLRKRLSLGLFVGESVRIGRDIARGLAKAHESGVVHRDLKPENVMVTDDGEVKILDFGIAKVMGPEAGDAPPPSYDQPRSATGTGSLLGTIAYMSPEQATGEPTDERSDVFSLGIMLYEMLAGALPFQGEKTLDVLHALVTDDPKPLDRINPEVTPELWAVVARCLAKEKSHRFASGAEVRAALEPFVVLLARGPIPSSTGSVPIVSASGPKLVTVAGLGPEHAATLATGSGVPIPAGFQQDPTKPTFRAPPPKGPTKGSPPTSGRPFVLTALFLLGGAVLAVVVTLGVRAQRNALRTEPLPAPPSASAEPARPQPGTEADRLYAQANADLAAGDLSLAMGGWERAAAKDPSLCAVHLRLAANQDAANARAREELEKVHKCEAILSPEDRALERVVAAFIDPTVSLPDKLLGATRAADAFPKSAEIAYYVASYLDSDTTMASDGLRWVERVLAADPSFAGAYAFRADQLRVVHRRDEARQAIEECFRHRPDAAICADRAFDLLAHDGHCAEAETYVRGLIARRPSAVFPYEMLSRLLIGLGAPMEAIAALEAQADALRAPEDAPSEAMKLRLLRQRCIVGGDFVCALDANSRALALETGRVDATVLWQYALTGTRLWREAGRPEQAREVMKTFNGRLPATEIDETFLEEHIVQTAEVSFELGLAPYSKVAEASAKTFAAFPVNDVFDRWTASGVADDPLPDEAKDVVRAAPPAAVLEANRENVVDIPTRAHRIGVNFLRAGQPAAARPWLEQAAKACTWSWRVEPVYPDKYEVQRARGFLAVGEARERTGDKAGAKEAYEEMVRRWGNAKPRSISAEKAKARLRALR